MGKVKKKFESSEIYLVGIHDLEIGENLHEVNCG